MASPLPTDPHGLIVYRDVAELGLRADLDTAFRHGEIERVGRGVYRVVEHDAGLSPAQQDAQRYRRTVLAAARRMKDAIFTSYSAAALLGLPVVGRWPEDVYVLARDRHARRRRGVVHVACDTAGRTAVVDGLVTTSVELTLIQLARHAPLSAALPAFDAAIHVPRHGTASPLTTRERIQAEHERLVPYPRRHKVEAVLDRCTPKAESAFESMSRLTIEELGFAEPELQVRFWLPELAQEAYLDFYWRDAGVGGEADGDGKYLDGAGAAGAARRVVDEKRREDELRAQLTGFVRWDWQDMWRRTPLERKLLRAGVPRPRMPRRFR
ncbi:hypothetical protein [Georgenia alba]|uniref:Transcriptional regulator, AbiEi antitoxin, Type IV TA system n=1 Tax=Georgenia alba TaxID=2233858 RepID=A0ABW2Q924_9MICO